MSYMSESDNDENVSSNVIYKTNNESLSKDLSDESISKEISTESKEKSDKKPAKKTPKKVKKDTITKEKKKGKGDLKEEIKEELKEEIKEEVKKEVKEEIKEEIKDEQKEEAKDDLSFEYKPNRKLNKSMYEENLDDEKKIDLILENKIYEITSKINDIDIVIFSGFVKEIVRDLKYRFCEKEITCKTCKIKKHNSSFDESPTSKSGFKTICQVCSDKSKK